MRSRTASVLWLLGTAVVALAGGWAVMRPEPAVAAGLLAAVALAVAASRWLRCGLVAWYAVLCFVPNWTGYKYLTPTALAAVLIGLAIARSRSRLSRLDLLAAGFLVLATVLFLGDLGDRGVWTSLVVSGLVPYLIARTLVAKVGVQWAVDAYAWAMVVVAGLAIVEFVLGWHPFVGVGGTSAGASQWAAVQARGGVVRSEGAFGHAIALGGSLVTAVPFLATAVRGGRWRYLGIVLVVGGVATTLSRGPMIAVAVTLLATVWLSGALPRRRRVGLSVALAVAAAAALPTLSGVQALAAGDLAASSRYRSQLFQQAVGDLNAFGSAASAKFTADGFAYRGFGSVDNAFLWLGLVFGWVLALGLLSVFVVIVARVVMRRGTPADAALAGQMPVLLTVALITQYQTVVFFLVGVAVTMHQRDRARPPAVDRIAESQPVG